MINRVKTVLLLLTQLLILQGVNGQKPIIMTDYLNEKFTSYIKQVPREEIYVHSDRDEFISGETLWFNIYLIDRQSSRPSLNSRVAYFELLNQENRPIVQKKILLIDGTGPGQLSLPDTLSSGTYTLRAYTNWMKNFLPFNCFVKEIKVYNSFSKRTNKTRINSESFVSGKSAVAINEVKNPGLSVALNNHETEFLNILVTTDEKYLIKNNYRIYLFIQTHGVVNKLSTESLTNGTTNLLVPKKQLSSGVNQITLFNIDGQVVFEQYIYTPVIKNTAIALHSADSIKRRDKITLDLDFGKAAKTGINSEFSISVSQLTNHHTTPDISDYMVFGSEFGFLPMKELGDRKLNDLAPSYVDSLLTHVSSNWIDWNLILADSLPRFKYQAEKDNIILTGKLLTGDQKTGDAGKYILLSTPGKTAAFKYAQTDENGNFNFSIHLDGKINDLIFQPDILVKNESLNLNSPFVDPNQGSGKPVVVADKQIPAYISSWSVNHQVMTIYGNYSAGQPVMPVLSEFKQKRFYGKPDNELLMKDYIKLPVMQEVFFELLPGVSLNNRKSGWEITLNDPRTNHPYETTPGLFIDGIKVKDPAIIAGLDPEVVEKIDVVREKYYVGNYLFYGIVNIITKTGDFSNVTLPAYAVRLPYRAIDPVASFTSPDYSRADRKKDHLADFRNTLYWNPSVKLSETGKARVEFWTSDYISDFEVDIQGVGADGNPYSIKKVIRVIK